MTKNPIGEMRIEDERNAEISGRHGTTEFDDLLFDNRSTSTKSASLPIDVDEVDDETAALPSVVDHASKKRKVTFSAPPLSLPSSGAAPQAANKKSTTAQPTVTQSIYPPAVSNKKAGKGSKKNSRPSHVDPDDEIDIEGDYDQSNSSSAFAPDNGGLDRVCTRSCVASSNAVSDAPRDATATPSQRQQQALSYSQAMDQVKSLTKQLAVAEKQREEDLQAMQQVHANKIVSVREEVKSLFALELQQMRSELIQELRPPLVQPQQTTTSVQHSSLPGLVNTTQAPLQNAAHHEPVMPTVASGCVFGVGAAGANDRSAAGAVAGCSGGGPQQLVAGYCSGVPAIAAAGGVTTGFGGLPSVGSLSGGIYSRQPPVDNAATVNRNHYYSSVGATPSVGGVSTCPCFDCVMRQSQQQAQVVHSPHFGGYPNSGQQTFGLAPPMPTMYPPQHNPSAAAYNAFVAMSNANATAFANTMQSNNNMASLNNMFNSNYAMFNALNNR